MSYPACITSPLSGTPSGGDHHGMPTNLHTPSLPTRRYARHEPEKTPLYTIVANHLEQLNNHLTRHETSLPVLVQREFADYLRCGRLEHGFIPSAHHPPAVSGEALAPDDRLVCRQTHHLDRKQPVSL